MKALEAKTLDVLLLELRRLDVKLWVEGDRLRYKAAKNALTPDLLAELRDRKAEILAFLKSASLAADFDAAAIPVVSRDGSLPLSIAQERLWYHHQFEPDSSLNNIITAYRIKGNLDIKLLDRVQHEIVQRHEILRTTFPKVDGKPTVAIAPGWELDIPVEDLQSVSVEERDEEAHRRAIAESRRPYDLEKGPLLRLRLLKLAPDDYLLVLTMHRMMADGVSVDIFFREMVLLYEAYLLDKPVTLPELPVQYVDFAHWQRQRLQGEFLETHLHYWKEHLKAPLPVINLPVSRPRPSTYSFNTLRRRLIFPRALNDALNTLSQEEEATLFMTLIAALKILLYRYSQQEDVSICCSNAGRSQAEVQSLIGPFFNTLALRTHLDGNPTFREVIQRVKQVALGAFSHQELPFEQLVPELNNGKSRGRSSLFQIFFALNPSWKDGNTLSTVELPGITFDTMFGYLYTGKTKFDLFLVMREAEEGLQLLFEYNSDLFDGEIILPLMDHFQTLLESAVENPDAKISQLSLLKPEAKQQLLASWHSAEWQYSSPCSGDRPGMPVDPNLPRTQVYILDRELQPVPVGALGELYIDENSLSYESPDSVEQASENFIFHPLQGKNGRLYKTGAIARYRPDGMIELVSHLEQELADVEPLAQREEVSYIASRDELEHQLTQIWEEVLDIQPVGIRDNFFDLGGHSLLAVRLFAQIEKEIGKNLPLSVLLQAPTIEQLATVLREEEGANAWSPLVKIQAGNPDRIPLFCVHGGGFNVLIYRDLALKLDSEQPVYGLQARGLTGRGSIWVNSIKDIAADYVNEIRTVQPKGPYILSGLSNGGNIALEMAQQLRSQGEVVALLALFDCYAPDAIELLPSLPRLISSLNYAWRYSLPRYLKKLRGKGILPVLRSTLFSKAEGKSQAQESMQPTRSEAEESNTSSAVAKPTHLNVSLGDWMDRTSQYILDHSPWASFMPKEQLRDVEGSLAETLKAMEDSYKKLHQDYQPNSYEGDVALFRAAEPKPGYAIDHSLGWKTIVMGDLKVYFVPGHHTSIMESAVLAERLQACLDRVQTTYQKTSQ
jgi:pimeloyl-ACP methyl ester carboxylesterase